MRPVSSLEGSESAAKLARALGDPVRLTILDRLTEGPAAVADLVARTGATQPKVSNHLAVLRDRKLVVARRSGRQSIYEIGDPSVAQLVESLLSISGTSSSTATAPASIALARTCYDHLAGKLGVAICDVLIGLRAIILTNELDREFALGPTGPTVFGRLGVEWSPVSRSRRRYAYQCLDWTERRPHLAGRLGAGLCERALTAGWVAREQDSRAVSVTELGRRTLKRHLAITI